MRIGIDARDASESPAGRGRVVRELLRALNAREDRHEYFLYARTAWDEPLGERFHWRLKRGRAYHLHAARAASAECEVFLSCRSYLTSLLVSVPCTTLVYDLVAFAPEMKPNRRSVIVERLTLRGAVRRSRVLLCISAATERELLARHPAARTRVALLGGALAGAEPTGEGCVLAVGTLEPRKNLPRLVAAYASLPAELQQQHPLYVVGAAGWETGETLAALASLGERCRRLGHLSDAELAGLYRGCAVFCYPSLGEGFGLPVLEAMSAGAAVITSGLSSLPEVGGDAVRYVDPYDVQSIARALGELLGDPRQRAALGSRARARASGFSWAAFAASTLEALGA
ncbi:MAG: hypothetical protein NVSMB51_22540 [Solirubrobacteraceae bacterium]